MQSIRRAAQLGDTGAVRGLCALINECDDIDTLTAVVKALGKIGDGSAIPALIAGFDKLEQSSLVNTLSELGVFDAAMPVGGASVSKQRRKIRAALRNADPDALKQLLVGGSLGEEEIFRVISL